MKLKKLGSVFTDVAALIIGDPCQLLADAKDQGDGKTVPTYDDYMDKVFARSEKAEREYQKLKKKKNPTLEESMKMVQLCMPPQQEATIFLNNHGGTAAIAVRTDADGHYPVFLESDDDGTPRRLIIELGGKTRP